MPPIRCRPLSQSSGKIDGEEGLEKQQPGCLPGKYQRAFHPQANGNKKIAEITEEKKILQAILPPIKGNPGDHAGRPKQLDP